MSRSSSHPEPVTLLESWREELCAIIAPALRARGIDADSHDSDSLSFKHWGRVIRITFDEIGGRPEPFDGHPHFDFVNPAASRLSPNPVPSEVVDRTLAAMAKGFDIPEDVVDPDD